MDSLNIVDMVKGYFSGGFANSVSTLLGESNQKTQMGLDAAIPGLLSAFTNTASTNEGATRLTSAVDGADEGILSNITSIFGKNTYSASSTLRSILGDKGLSDLSGSIGRVAGLSGGSITTVLGMVAPVVLSVLKRLKRSQGLDASGLTSLLFSQRDNIAAAMPQGMTSFQPQAGVREPFHDARREQRATTLAWILPLAILALLAGLSWHWARGRNVRAGQETGRAQQMAPHNQQGATGQVQTFASLETLKNKYNTAIQSAQQQGIQISGITQRDGKLAIQGSAPSAEAANRFKEEIRRINPAMDDVVVDLNVAAAQSPAAQSPAAKSTEAEPNPPEDVTRAKPAAPGTGTKSGSQMYTVRAGDTLAIISKRFYGNTSGSMRIFQQNRGRLKSPNALVVGQILEIPAK